MVDAARSQRASVLRRDSVLEAVAFAAERLLLSTDWREATPEVLARLGQATAASRALFIETTYDDDGRAYGTHGAEWALEGVGSLRGRPSLDRSPWDEGFGRWAATMVAGDPIVGLVDDVPPGEAAELRRQGVASLAYHPVHVDGEWVGCVGLDDCEVARAWTPAELDAVRAIATLFGAAMARSRQDERLREAELGYRTVVERIPAVTYVSVIEPTSVSLGFVSPQMEALLGLPVQGFLDDPDLWFSLIHPDDLDRVDTAARASRWDGLPFDEEYRMRHADGHWVWVHDTSAPVHDDLGEVTHFQGFMIDVTSRKTAEHRYRAVVESIPAVTYVDEPTGDPEPYSAMVSFVSPQIEQMLGYPSQAFMDDANFWFSLIHHDDLVGLRARDAFSVDDVAPFDEEYRMRHADGHWVWVHDTSTAVLGPGGTADYFQGFMIDVTARHDAEERTRHAEERFRVLVEQLPALTYTERVAPGSTGADRMDYMSPQAERLLGYPVQAWLDDVEFWATIVHRDDEGAARAAIDHANATGEPLSVDFRLRAADGRVVWVHEESVLIRDEDGNPVVWQGFMLDITERKEAEEALRLTEEQFRTIVEHTPAITYQEVPMTGDYDPATTFPYVSPHVESILGYSQEQWATTPGFWAQVTHPDDLQAVIDESRRTNETGEPYRQEYRIIAADGRVVWFLDESHLIRGTDGSPVVWQGVMVDITERKEAEAGLRRAQERLEALIEHIPRWCTSRPRTPMRRSSTSARR